MWKPSLYITNLHLRLPCDSCLKIYSKKTCRNRPHSIQAYWKTSWEISSGVLCFQFKFYKRCWKQLLYNLLQHLRNTLFNIANWKIIAYSGFKIQYKWTYNEQGFVRVLEFQGQNFILYQYFLLKSFSFKKAKFCAV